MRVKQNIVLIISIIQKKMCPISIYSCQDIGSVYFDSKENAQLAIDTFYNELIWYFTKYEDSL